MLLMETINLTKGYAVIVDDEDADLASYRWHALVAGPRHIYASRHRRKSEGDGRGVVLLHREIASRMGAIQGMDVDHISGDTLDCRRANLRSVSHRDNIRNRQIGTDNTSGHLGVTYSARQGAKPWRAMLGSKFLGWHSSKEEAIAARLNAEREQWGVQPRRAEAFA